MTARVSLKGIFLGSILLLITSKDSTNMSQASNQSAANPPGREVITLGGGCFWCIEAVFQRLKGVKSVASGYAGGDVPNPTYKAVCTGDTGHAEVVHPPKLTASRLRAAIERVLRESRYRETAQRCRDEIQTADGLRRAADLVEQTFRLT